MFEKLRLTEWILEDFGSEVGLVKANFNYLKENKVANICTKENQIYELMQVGKMDFTKLDEFIKRAMNSFYETLNEGTSEEQERKKDDYKHLYEIWQDIMLAKQNNSSNVSDLYNDLIFALHMMGYDQ